MTYIAFRTHDSLPEDCEIDGWEISFSGRMIIDYADCYHGYEVTMLKDHQLILFTMDAFDAESAYLRTEILKQMIKDYSA